MGEEESSISSSPLHPITPAPKVKREPVSVLPSARGAKRKTMHERIEEMASQDRSQRIKLTDIKEKQKTARAIAKYDAKNSLEMARLQHQQREAEAQRQHELVMMERQMQLEAMRQRQLPPAPASTNPYGAGAPAYGALLPITSLTLHSATELGK
jgi:hypothetical protein